ncbi:dienelactone hydrolase family protein [Roseibium sp.]|uniref:dienelactone hydrolase family protein n=1 Tax=Roseibium sp. TaxID=1936156 RepID=UPI003B5104CC
MRIDGTSVLFNMLTRLLQVCAVLLLLVLKSNAQDSVFVGDVPLPDDAASPPSVSNSFVGTWVGTWDHRRNHILVVEEVTDDGRARVIYAVGRDQHNSGRWFRRQARVEGNTLTFDDGGFPARYVLSRSGRLRGVFADNKGFTVLQRQNLPELLASPTGDWFTVGTFEYLDTGLIEGGAPVRLAAVLYFPKGPGPFPLALIHHGSTGSGKNPRAFDQVWSADWLADVLNANGWLVAFPQRRGRGLSDGLYDEGFAVDRSNGYSPDKAIALAGADRALMDANAALAALKERADIADGKTLLGGMSRGGVVAILQAGHRPEAFSGVLNFVGGWVSEGWGDPEINPTLFRRIGSFHGPVLSIYGEDDPYYSVAYSKSYLAEMDPLGADHRLHVVKVSGHGNGHWALFVPSLWGDVVDSFLMQVR